MEFNSLEFVKSVARDQDIYLSPTRIEFVAGRVDENTAYETVVALLQVAYDSVGPKGLSATLRLTEEEDVILNTLVASYSTVFKKATPKDIFIMGIREALHVPLKELPAFDPRVKKRTVRIDRTLDKLIKDCVAAYSNEAIEITYQQALLFGLYGAYRKYAQEVGRA